MVGGGPGTHVGGAERARRRGYCPHGSHAAAAASPVTHRGCGDRKNPLGASSRPCPLSPLPCPPPPSPPRLGPSCPGGVHPSQDPPPLAFTASRRHNPHLETIGPVSQPGMAAGPRDAGPAPRGPPPARPSLVAAATKPPIEWLRRPRPRPSAIPMTTKPPTQFGGPGPALPVGAETAWPLGGRHRPGGIPVTRSPMPAERPPTHPPPALLMHIHDPRPRPPGHKGVGQSGAAWRADHREGRLESPPKWGWGDTPETSSTPQVTLGSRNSRAQPTGHPIKLPAVANYPIPGILQPWVCCPRGSNACFGGGCCDNRAPQPFGAFRVPCAHRGPRLPPGGAPASP